MAKHGMRMRLNPSVLKKIKAQEAQARASRAEGPEPVDRADSPEPAEHVESTADPSAIPAATPDPSLYAPINRLRYSPELGRKICRLIASGQTVTAICRHPDMPGSASVFVWLRDHEEFRKQYRIALQFARDQLDDQILEIADDMSKDVVALKDRTGKSREVLNPVAVQRARVRVLARQRMIDRNKAMKPDPRFDADGNPIETAAPAPLATAPTGFLLTEGLRAEMMAIRRKAILQQFAEDEDQTETTPLPTSSSASPPAPAPADLDPHPAPMGNGPAEERLAALIERRRVAIEGNMHHEGKRPPPQAPQP